MNPTLLRAALADPNAARDAVEKELCERSLEEFVRRAWDSIVPQAYEHNWHVSAICQHLEEVANGNIRRLLVNIPPRFAKTVLCSVMFPVWVWIQNKDENRPLVGPGATFLCISYGSDKSTEDAVTARRLIASEFFQKHWGSKVIIAKDRDSQERFDSQAGGSRISVGIQAAVLGRGGNIKILDDCHKPDEAESALARNAVLKAYDETLSSRENDPRIAAEVIIAQRLHENDLPGHVLTKYGSDPEKGGFTHLCLPLEYDSQRHCRTIVAGEVWDDPRGLDEDGELLPDDERALRDGTSLWPKRFPRRVIEQRKLAEGSYSYSAKYGQIPVPRGGGVVKHEWWQTWPPQGEEFDSNGKPTKPLAFPAFEYIVASLDTALTAKQSNDPSALTVWGVFRDTGGQAFNTRETITGDRDELPLEYASGPKIMLMTAWESHSEFHELLNRVITTCRARRVDRLIIEAKSAGHSIAQELQRLLRGEQFGVMLQTPKGDKRSRMIAVSHMWEAALVYAPNRAWAEKVKDQCSAVDMGAHDDLADSASAAIKHLRSLGEALTLKEHERDVMSDLSWQGDSEPLYDV